MARRPQRALRAYTRGEVDFDAQRMARANELQAAFGGELLDDAAYVDWKDLFWGTFEASWTAFADSVGCSTRSQGPGCASAR